MSRKLFSTLFALLVIASMVLSACGAPTDTPVLEPVPVEPTRESAAPAVPAATDAPAPTDEPAKPSTTRKGGWLDEIVFSVVSGGSAVTQLQAGAIDIYGDSLAADSFPFIRDAGLGYAKANGLFYEITYNPVGPVFESTGKLNPFSVPAIREATNWLYNRDYLNQEVYAGGSLAKFLPITTQFPDYADLADVARKLEAKYAYDPQKADAVISAEMEKLGATRVDGKWTYNNEPVKLILLIRTDSDGTRVPVGDYVANQLESIGFAVERQYKTSSEASPLWIQGNPADGLWHLYTGAWSANIIDRDQGDNIQYYFTPASQYGFSPLWQAYQPVDEMTKLADDLAYNRFTNLEQRRIAFARAIELSLEDSVRVWLIDGKSFSPYKPNVQVSYDLAAGVDGAQVWPYTLRFKDQEGGLMKWGGSDLFVDPWNPVAGSNWAFDAAPQRATQSGATMADPYTGLYLPFNAEKAEVTMEEGLPVGVTHPWVKLDFAAKIDVPADAWVDWDAENGKFITAAEKYPEGVTAKTKTVVYYPSNLYDRVKWHDGSHLSAADFIINLIMTFDSGKEASPIYDASRVSNLEAFMSIYKGSRIVSTEPLVIEYYSDAYSLDAEVSVGLPVLATMWPQYGFGEAGWHQIAIGNLAEQNGELAYSTDKADAAEIEWMSFVGGPSLEILSKYLDQAAAESYIPYPNVLGQYLTAEEAAARYANLKAWYDKQGHFWLGTGPYYLDKVFLTEKTLNLKVFPDYPDLADRWAGFGEPKIAEVQIDGAGQVLLGSEAIFDVFVNFKGQPYPKSEIKQVTVLLYNAENEIIYTGQAEAIADGQYQVVLSAAETANFEAGSHKIEVAVVPLPVSIPTFTSIDFVTLAP